MGMGRMKVYACSGKFKCIFINYTLKIRKLFILDKLIIFHKYKSDWNRLTKIYKNMKSWLPYIHPTQTTMNTTLKLPPKRSKSEATHSHNQSLDTYTHKIKLSTKNQNLTNIDNAILNNNKEV